MASGAPAPSRSDRRTFEVFAPVRVDLAGGTLDLWPLYCLHPGSLTVNSALAAGVRIRVIEGGGAPGTIRHSSPDSPPIDLVPDDAGCHIVAAVGFHLCPAGGLEVEVLAQPPVGSGLGASSALAVAVARGCGATMERGARRPPTAETLRDLEARVLGVPTGVQDYLPAMLGGTLAIHLEPGGERVERLPVPRGWLEERLVVVYSGISHSSGVVNWQVYRARVDGDRAVAAALTGIAAAAVECRRALLALDEAAVGEAVAAEWNARRRLAPSVTNPALDGVLAAGSAAGALAAKACGAGGGGSVLFWVPPARRRAVREAVLAAAPAGAFEVAGGLSSRGAIVRRATIH
jgi:D-glycero-alpha-D-manno-heptose-7-phosphate kinase